MAQATASRSLKFVHDSGAAVLLGVALEKNNMAMTPEILMMLDGLGKTIAAAIEKANAGGGSRGPARRKLDERMFRRVDKFDGASSWNDFAFVMKSAARSGDRAVVETMEWAEKYDKGELTVQEVEDYVVDTDVDSSGSELFDILVSLTGDEATTDVRGMGVSRGRGWSTGTTRTLRRRPCRS